MLGADWFYRWDCLGLVHDDRREELVFLKPMREAGCRKDTNADGWHCLGQDAWG